MDQGVGDIFTARVAGNVLNDDILGSMEFACKASGSKLITVIGHSNCGAIKGAVDDVELGNLTGLLAKIKPAMDAVPADVQPRTSKNYAFVDQVSEANVRLVMQEIRDRSPILREMLDKEAKLPSLAACMTCPPARFSFTTTSFAKTLQSPGA